ncbi:MAG: hypothetical protein AAFX06_18430, partial [Planctomycetota bacterium]
LNQLKDDAFSTQRLQRSAQARMHRAAILAKSGRGDEAAGEYETAIEELNAAWQSSDPDDFYRRHLADAERDLGTLLLENPSRHDAAEVYLERSLQTYLELMRQQPSVSLLRKTTQANCLLGRLNTTPSERVAALERATVGFEMLRDHDVLSESESLQWIESLVELGELAAAQGADVSRIADQIHQWRSQENPVTLQAEVQQRIEVLLDTVSDSNSDGSDQSSTSR